MPEIQKKRKRAPKEDTEEAGGDGLDPMEVLRRHFESQFAPLPEVKGSKKKTKAVKGAKKAKIEAAPEEDESEWEGVSNEEDDGSKPAVPTPKAPEVIHFTGGDPLRSDTKLPKSILKPFISSKPPPIGSFDAPASTAAKKPDESDEEDDMTEANLLKNDLALQRLLKESHLLDENLEATGKNRLKALESRVQALGGKDLTKHKMPMQMRINIAASKKAKEEKRRKEAKEAGIILEKEVRVKKDVKKRDRGFGPSIGKFRNGTLVLSKKDVMDIEGRSGGGGGGKGGKGRGKSSKGGKGKKRR